MLLVSLSGSHVEKTNIVALSIGDHIHVETVYINSTPICQLLDALECTVVEGRYVMIKTSLVIIFDRSAGHMVLRHSRDPGG